jgi:hypothetical protein
MPALWPRQGLAQQESLGSPAGRVILSISGRISATNVAGEAHFDREMLESLGMESFTTRTPWYEGAVTFEGVRMTRLMERVVARGTTLTVTALNDYSTELPIGDFERFGTLLALKRDGQYMPVRDRGPLFLVYPYDSTPELSQRLYYARSAWQLARMAVR